MTGRARPRRQPLVIRLTHAVTAGAALVLALTGLEVLAAYPWFGPVGAPYAWMPLQGWTPPGWLRAGAGLPGARALHLAAAWVLVAAGLAYVGYLVGSGQWRRRLFWPPRDAAPALRALVARLRRAPVAPLTPASPGARLATTLALALGLALVSSGLALWQPVQLAPLARVLGGVDGARAVHFLALLALGAWTAVHVARVLLAPRRLLAMFTGGAREEEAS